MSVFLSLSSRSSRSSPLSLSLLSSQELKFTGAHMVEDQTKSPVSVCLTCGDEGYKESLWSCNNCQISAEHGYCLARMPDPDDEEFTYICAQCISSSTKQSSSKPSLLDALRPRPSRKKKHGRHQIDVPASHVQDLERGLTNRSPCSIDQPATLAQDQEKREADKDYSNVCGINQPDALIQDLEKRQGNDVLPQADVDKNMSACCIDEPDVLVGDVERRQVKGCSPIPKVETVQTHGVSPLQTSVPGPTDSSPHFCGDQVLKKSRFLLHEDPNRSDNDQMLKRRSSISNCLNKSDKDVEGKESQVVGHFDSRIDEPDVLVEDVEKRQAKDCSPIPQVETVQTDNISHLQASVLDPTKSSQHCCGDQVLKRSRSLLHEDLSRSDNDQVLKRRSFSSDSLNNSDKDVEGKESQVVAFGHFDSRSDEPDALVEDVEKRQAKGCSPIPEVETVQTHGVSPLKALVLGPTKSSQHCCGDQVLKMSRSLLHEDMSRSDHDQVLKMRSSISDNSLNKSDKDVEEKKSQVGVFGQVNSIARGGQFEISSPCPLIEHPHFDYAQPIADPAWRGCFEFTKGSYDFSREKFGRVIAHISSVACLEVHEAAKLMPAVLCAKMMPRLEAWPESFKLSTPTDKNIALYFFPESESVVKSYDRLVNSLNNCDYAVKVWLENAELLLFSSNQLPPRYWRFNGKYYLWGVFRGDGHIKQSGGIGNMHHSTIEITKQSDSSESMRKSPLSPLSMNGSYGSGSPRSPLPPTRCTNFPLQSPHAPLALPAPLKVAPGQDMTRCSNSGPSKRKARKSSKLRRCQVFACSACGSPNHCVLECPEAMLVGRQHQHGHRGPQLGLPQHNFILFQGTENLKVDPPRTRKDKKVQNKDEMHCFRCLKLGHFARECERLPQQTT